MFEALSNWLGIGGWMVNPLLFLIGVPLISVPIIIHLLNKQKYKVVDWAAMDFLLEAEKKNHRRVRLENLLILLLRCLAILLIALLIARPFRPHGLFGERGDVVNFKRIVILDDSISMAARDEGETAFRNAKKQLKDFVKKLSENNANNYLTILLTSRPHQPLVNNMKDIDDPNSGAQADLLKQIDELQPSDRPARMELALGEAQRIIDENPSDGDGGGQRTAVNSVVYVISDLRSHDWSQGNNREAQKMIDALKAFRRSEAVCYLVDVGVKETANLSVSKVVPVNKVLIAGVESQFDVEVQNHGPNTVTKLDVQLTIGDSRPEVRRIARIEPGGTGRTRFRYMFTPPVGPPKASAEPESVPVKAEILVKERPSDDVLTADNVRYYAARVYPTVPVLLIDGDHREEAAKSETFYLRRALSPPYSQAGDERSGFTVTVTTPEEIIEKSLRFEDYQIVFLCNVFQLDRAPVVDIDDANANKSKKRAKPEAVRRLLGERLERWVRDGGRLVITLGDQIDRDRFNAEFYRHGLGLSPLKLKQIQGDETEKTWARFRIADENHSVTKPFYAAGTSLLEYVKVFRWWTAVETPDAPVAAAVGAAASLAGRNVVSVPLELVKDGRFPALAEKQFGLGRCALLTTAVDADWTTWTHDDPTFPLFMIELSRYLMPPAADFGTVEVGEPFEMSFDGNAYALKASLHAPAKGKVPLYAKPLLDAQGKPRGRLNRYEYLETEQSGFYRMELTPIRRAENGAAMDAPQSVEYLFAANVSPTEGDLTPLDKENYRKTVGDRTVRWVNGDQLALLSDEDAKGEFWIWVLVALAIVLVSEQLLGWCFGLRR